MHNAASVSRWSADNADDAWIKFHFDQESAVEAITVDWGNAFANEYSLAASDDDGIAWGTSRPT